MVSVDWGSFFGRNHADIFFTFINSSQLLVLVHIAARLTFCAPINVKLEGRGGGVVY